MRQKVSFVVATCPAHLSVRMRVTNFLFADIIFTSGGTEVHIDTILGCSVYFIHAHTQSNSMVLHSALCYRGYTSGEGKGKPHIITSNLEHDSVFKCLERYEKDGLAGMLFNVCY